MERLGGGFRAAGAAGSECLGLAPARRAGARPTALLASACPRAVPTGNPADTASCTGRKAAASLLRRSQTARP